MLRELLNKVEKIAIPLSLRCGKILMDEWDTVKICRYKGKNDFCTNLDLRVEEKILGTLGKHFQDHNTLAEESGFTNRHSKYTWIIDPLDGTKNYTRKLAIFNTTMALQKDNQIIFGLIYSPATKELFHATRGKGAYRVMTDMQHRYLKETKQKLKVSNENLLKKSIIHIDVAKLKQSSKFLESVHRFRALGAGALSLAYTALGAFDASLDIYGIASVWDVAAGTLLVEEAGGTVTDLEGKKYTPKTKITIASNGHIHAQLLKLIHTLCHP